MYFETFKQGSWFFSVAHQSKHQNARFNLEIKNVCLFSSEYFLLRFLALICFDTCLDEIKHVEISNIIPIL